MPVRHTITFTGRVQGVGFRARARDLAAGFAVVGFVRNEIDGSVLCVAEGERTELESFLGAVRQAMNGFIRDSHVHETPANGEFTGFGIRR